MSDPSKLHNDFCLFRDWGIHVPPPYDEHDEAYWLARSRKGKWAGYSKALTERSQAIWRRSDVLVWFELTWGEYWPSSIAALKAAGFCHAALPTGSQPKYRKRQVT